MSESLRGATARHVPPLTDDMVTSMEQFQKVTYAAILDSVKEEVATFQLDVDPIAVAIDIAAKIQHHLWLEYFNDAEAPVTAKTLALSASRSARGVASSRASRKRDRPEQKSEARPEVMPAPTRRSDAPRYEEPYTLGSESVNVASYLAALDAQPKPEVVVRPRVRVSTVRTPSGMFKSSKIAGHNNDCVLAAFASIKGISAIMPFEHMMSSQHDVIVRIAAELGMRQVSATALTGALQSGTRAWIQAEALSGGGYHAYCAFGLAGNGNVLAYDTDNTETDVKEIPVSLVTPAFI